jgi:hypothetical protein
MDEGLYDPTYLSDLAKAMIARIQRARQDSAYPNYALDLNDYMYYLGNGESCSGMFLLGNYETTEC